MSGRNPVVLTKSRRKDIGNALWLLVVLANKAPAGWNAIDRVMVADGAMISDADLAWVLDTALSTIARWRLTLKRAGVLDWLGKPGCGRVFFLQALDGPMPATPQPKSANPKSKSAAEPSAPERWVQ